MAVLRPAVVAQFLGVSRQTLYRWRADGTFPKPIALGPNSIGWHQSDVEHWLAARPERAK